MFKALALAICSGLLATSAQAEFGVRGSVGYASGLTALQYGSNVATSNSYMASPGSGLAYSLEGLYSLNQAFELGLGFSPIGVDAKESSSYSASAGNAEKNESSYKFSSLPIILTGYLKMPLSTKFGFWSGLGLGYASGGDFSSSIRTDYSFNGVPTSGSKSDNTDSMDGAIAYRGVAGLDYKFSPAFSIFGCLNLVAIAFAPSKSVYNYGTSNGAGVETYHYSETTTYQNTAPTRSPSPSSSTVDNRVAGTGTVVTSSDNGIRSTTNTSTYVSGVPVKTESVNNTKAQRTLTTDVMPLSLQVGATYRF